jgi:putative ABC transport system permease protein
MSDPGIPRWVLKFLRAICPDHLLEEIEGDLFERFSADVKFVGLRKAKRRLIWNTLRYFRPGILMRNPLSLDITFLFMITNYFKVATRVMFRNKTFSAINVLGLSFGMTGAILLFLWIGKEFTYEQFHTDKDRIFKAWNRSTENNEVTCWDVTPRILAPTLKEEFASIERSTSYAAWGSKHLFTVGETRMLKTSGAYADADFLSIFSFPLLKGDVSTALNDPSSIVLTESLAKELFHDQEAFGSTITVGESGSSFEFKVAGILKELPTNTEFRFEYLLPFRFLESIGENDTYWGNNSVSTFVKIKEGTDITVLNNSVANVERKHFPEGDKVEIFLYPLSKMRLYSRFENGVVAGGRIEIIRMLGILGVCLIVIACINFINLSTARAQRRAKEVAVRKVTGAYRRSLIIQFLCESILIAFVAGLISLCATYLLLPAFNNLVGQQLELQVVSIRFWVIGAGFVTFIGCLAGFYPAFYLSAFRPARILKGAVVMTANRNFMRNALVVFQFGFAITLIVSAIVINRQINYVQNREAGYDKSNLVYLPLTGDLQKNYLSFRNDLLQSNVAVSITKTSAPITERWSNTNGIEWRGKKPEDNVNIERIYMDEHFITTAGLTLAEGRDMDLDAFSSDSTAVLLNESAAKLMGFDNPVGEIIIDNDREWKVIGVVKDFILTSPYQKVEPIVLLGSKSAWTLQYVHIRLNPLSPVQQNITTLSDLATKYNPNYPFEYYFADVEYQRKFANLETTQTITTVFTSIAIFIACLGLFGLSTYMTEARVKEIGIRKIFGGTVASITRLLSISSLKPIVIAIILFSPASWYAMNWWLNSFAYRVEMNLIVFLWAALSILFIALLTISMQTISAARANPIKSIKSE